MRIPRLVAASAALTMGVGLAGVPTGFADKPEKSHLVAAPNPVTVNANPEPAEGEEQYERDVTVRLDENCHNAIGVTQYTIVAGTSSYVDVSPSEFGPMDCDGVATFTITGVAETPEGGAILRFSAVAKNTGLNKKIGGTDLTVIVVDTREDDGVIAEPPVSDGRPAAPAIANALLKTVPGLADACKAALAGPKGKGDWRGRTISTIAGAMPKPESVKDDTSAYPEDEDWIEFVKSELGDFGGLYGLCGFQEPEPES